MGTAYIMAVEVFAYLCRGANSEKGKKTLVEAGLCPANPLPGLLHVVSFLILAKERPSSGPYICPI